MSWHRKVAIVTGGGQGIGKAIAKAFLEQGMNVAIAEIDPEAGTATAAEFQPLGSIQFIQKLMPLPLASVQIFVTGANFIIDGGMTRKMIYS